MFDGVILALDIASNLGWAEGRPGERPRAGTVALKREGSSHEAIAARCFDWIVDWIKVSRPNLIVFEQPLPPQFKGGFTNINTTQLLFGLPLVIGTVAFKMGIYSIRRAKVTEVRHHFIACNPKRDEAKELTKLRCKLLGWDACDDNAADALALWSFQVSVLRPDVAPPPVSKNFRTVRR